MVTETATVLPTTEDVCEMDKLMSDGKRNYICNQPHLALDCFVEVCEKLSKWYGQESDKCVDAYLFYGKTLLDIARLENGVLGHAIKEMPQAFGSGGETDEQDTEKDVNTEDEEDAAPKMGPEEIQLCVSRALREDNMYPESTEDEGEHTEEEEEGEIVEETATNAESKASTSTCASTSSEATTTTTPEVDDGIDCGGILLIYEVNLLIF